MKTNILLIIIMMTLLAAIGCGGSTNTKTNPTTAQNLIDPSGNWRQEFTDASGNTFLLSALYDQVGATVTGINFSEVGTPFNFACAAQRDISLSNGIVQNVNQFSGTLTGNFGVLTFTSVLNDAGTHASGTYTLVPGVNGNCLNIALTGTYTGDEVPSMTGNWTGTITCPSDCPVGSTSGTISMSLTQDDATGALTGSYVVTGLPGLGNGTLIPDPAGNNLLSGSSIQQRMTDNIAGTVVMVGGPLNSFGTAGVGLDRTFQGNILAQGTSSAIPYLINMSH